MGRPIRSNKNVAPSVAPVGGVREDIRALNSSILLITQKIKYVVRNEKILGRNLIVLNKKLKSLEEKIIAPKDNNSNTVSSEELSSLKKKVDLLEAQIVDIQSRMVSKEEFKELKYIIDSINPLEFATLSQVKDLFNKMKKE